MKNIFFFLSLLFATAVNVRSQDLATLESKRVSLPNGWSLTPAGTSLPLGDLPLNIAVSASGRYEAVTNNGQSTQTVQLIDAESGRQIDQVIIGKSWGGIAFSGDEKSLYVSGGDDNWIIRYAIRSQKLIPSDTFKLGNRWPEQSISPAGITLDDRKHRLYVVTKQDNSLYVIDLASHRILHKLGLSAEAYTCLLSPDGEKLYLSVWGGKEIMIYNTGSNRFTDSVTVGDHPNDLCLSKDGRFLYVANANDNSVSVVDTRTQKVLETLDAALYPTNLSGSTTNSVSLSQDGQTLYIANADNNCLAVFDVSNPSSSRSKGFIPTGWYPTCVRVIGNKIYVANGKGFSSYPNPQGPNPTDVKEHVGIHTGDTLQPRKTQYIGGGLLIGSLSIIPIPSQQILSVYSQAVYHNTPYNKKEELVPGGEAGNPVGNPIPRKVGDLSPIKHVFYVIKENRTYDQVLGDVKEGNGDPGLVLFGKKVTPNQHAIAKEFVLLDNFYVDGEVSADGHNWSMGAYATDYMEKNWPTSYGSRGKGAVGLPALDKEYIWDLANRMGISYRTYGEFASGKNTKIPVLKGHYVKDYAGFNLRIRDTSRYRVWERDFDSLVAHHALPQLMTVYFPNDHTEGMKAGRPTPFAHVADNDLAMGMFLEHLSKSPVWKESVVFVLEDDAQNGPDHVDAHRSPAYIAGGYVKRHFVDHTMYATSSIIRTIELILGMPPMSQYDAAATPMWRSFSEQPDTGSFTCLPEQVDLNQVSPDGTHLAKMSKNLDFSSEDLVPDQLMNVITWKGVKGEHSVMPTPVRAAFVRTSDKADDDDE